MDDIKIGQEMYDKALDFINNRYPTGWGGCAIMYTKEEEYLLTACGICQERLHYWGKDVKVAVTNPNNEIIFKTLEELSPFYWANAFNEEK